MPEISKAEALEYAGLDDKPKKSEWKMAFMDRALKRLEEISTLLSNVEDRPDYNKPEISQQHDEYLKLYKYVKDRAPEKLSDKHKIDPITKIQVNGNK